MMVNLSLIPALLLLFPKFFALCIEPYSFGCCILTYGSKVSSKPRKTPFFLPSLPKPWCSDQPMETVAFHPSQRAEQTEGSLSCTSPHPQFTDRIF